MSHVNSDTMVIQHLDCLIKALSHFAGAEWKQGQKTHAWFGHHVGDHPIPQGFSKADMGKCSHAIHLDGCSYEIGVAEDKEKRGTYRLLYDFWGPGMELIKKFGTGRTQDGLMKLQERYQFEVAKKVYPNCSVDFVDSEQRAADVNKRLRLTGRESVVHGGKNKTIVSQKPSLMQRLFSGW